MRKAIYTFGLVVVIVLSSFGQELQPLADFFAREGYIVEVLKDRVVLDLGKGKAYRGEVFDVIGEGKKLVHPKTGKIIGVLEEKRAVVQVEEVRDSFSIASVREEKHPVEKGQKVRLRVGSVCFEGGDEGWFKVSSLLEDVKRGKECDYVIKELSGGFGVEFRGKPVAFFESQRPVKVAREIEPQGKKVRNIEVRAKMVMSLKEIPASADACDLYGNGKDSLLVLTQSKLEIYEVLRGSLIHRGSYNLPAGYPVSLACVRTQRSRGAYIFVNLISNGEINAVMYKMVGDSPVVVRDNIPFFINVLDRDRAEETLYGQEFNSEELWGKVYRLKIAGDEVVTGKAVRLPRDFRIDGAFMAGDILVYVNEDRTLRVYKGDNLLLSRDDFGGSYTQAQYPEMYEDLGSLSFNPKSTYVKIGDAFYPLIIRNKGSAVFRFLEVLKFKEAELYSVFNTESESPDLKLLKSDRLEEAIQAIVRLSDGRVIAITGRAGTIPIYNRGEVYELSLEPIY